MYPHNLTLDMMRAAIARKHATLQGRPFSERENGPFIVFNYEYAHPDLFKGEEGPILRECRGLMFYKDGRLASRPYHKFFNAGEWNGEDTPGPTVYWGYDFARPHHFLAKLDGSLIRPVLVDREIRFASKAGLTDVSAQVDVWAQSNRDLKRFCGWMLATGYTPIFEWCSRKMRVVIDYPKDRLVLTGLRNNETGEYIPYDQMVALAEPFGVEVVGAFGPKASIPEFVEYIRSLPEEEGCVIRFQDGTMIKVKADEYLRLHGTLDLLKSDRTMVKLLVSGEIDDAKARIRAVSLPAVEAFEKAFWEGVGVSAQEVLSLVQEARAKGLDAKAFALEGAAKHRFSGALFKLFRREKLDLGEAIGVVREILHESFVQRECKDGDRYSPFWGSVSWKTYNQGFAPLEGEE